MSRGFVREEDQEEPPFIPPRAPLAVGQPNYVTKTGLDLLEKEKTDLELERKNLTAENDKERRKQLAELNGKLSLLDERLASAQLIKAEEYSSDEVRFGTTVNFKVISSKSKDLEKSFTIVGVDEANIKLNKIAYTAPIVNALIGKRIGEKSHFKMGGNIQEIEIIAISCK